MFSVGRQSGARQLPYFDWFGRSAVFVPFLWSHMSDDARVFGRFSLTFMTVVMMNIALIAGFLVKIRRFRQVSAFLRRRSKAIAGLCPHRHVNRTDAACRATAAGYTHERCDIFVCLSSQFAGGSVVGMDICHGLIGWRRRCRLFPLASTGVALLSVAALIMVPRFFVGIGGAEALVGGGFCSGDAGSRMGRCNWAKSQVGWVRMLKKDFGERARRIFVIAYVIIVVGQIRLLPDFAQFAREWDERHSTATGIERKRCRLTMFEYRRRAGF